MRTRAQPLLGTLVEIGVCDAAPDVADAAIARAFAAVREVQRLMSYHDEASDVSRLNAMGAGVTVVDPHTWAVLAAAQTVAEASDGRFDITVAPALARHGYLPRRADRDAEAGATWRDIALLPDHRVCLRRRLRLDLGGIAKGYAVDRAVGALVDAGIAAGRVNAGGDLRLFGDTDETVHVRDPARPTALMPLCLLRRGAVATSSTYYSRRPTSDGLVSPLIDAVTRRPCTATRSVSVVADRCVLADALTKVVFAAPDAAPPILQRLGAHALVLEADADAPHGCRLRASAEGSWRPDRPTCAR
jgi:thiamine biosynthesis lipoprotein